MATNESETDGDISQEVEREASGIPSSTTDTGSGDAAEEVSPSAPPSIPDVKTNIAGRRSSPPR